MNYKIVIAISLASFVLGGALVHRYAKKETEVEIREVIKYKERVRTVTEVIERPDGTRETRTIEETQRENESDNQSREKTVVTALPKYALGITVGARNFANQSEFTVTASQRIIGNLHGSVYGRSDGEFGVGFRYDF